MAEEEKDKAQASEEPTPKRLEDARKKGQVVFSREVTSFLLFLIFTIYLLTAMPQIMKNATLNIAPYLTQVHNFEFHSDSDDVLRFASKIILELLLLMGIPMLITIIATFVSNFMQHGFLFSPEAFKFDPQRISPIAGLKRVFSLRSVVELLKTVAKMIILISCIYFVLSPFLKTILSSYDTDMRGFMKILWSTISRTFIAVCILSAILAVLDFMYQRHEYYKNLRMTKQEVKEELKHTEGNPEIRAKLRAIREERAHKRMILAVPSADVIITNPTHYAIALKYDAASMPAPQIIAKGMDYVALKIIEVGRENHIPITRNPPLARALYEVELEEYVPYEHYKAVAEIITRVMKI